MQQRRLEEKRVLVTSCDLYTGPAIVELFRAEGAHVASLSGPTSPRALEPKMYTRSGW